MARRIRSWRSASVSSGAGEVRSERGRRTRRRTFKAGGGGGAEQSRRYLRRVAESVRGVGRDVGRVACLQPDGRKIAQPYFERALEDAEALLEVVPVRWRTPPGGISMSSIANRPAVCSPESSTV